MGQYYDFIVAWGLICRLQMWAQVWVMSVKGGCVGSPTHKSGVLCQKQISKAIAGNYIPERLCQKQVSRARISKCISQILWGVITCHCLWHLLLAQYSTIMWNTNTHLRHNYKAFKLKCQRSHDMYHPIHWGYVRSPSIAVHMITDIIR